jgi:formylglycine-generating enzyme required for sulfatase activity
LGLAGDLRYEQIEWVKISGGRFWMGAQKQNQFYHNFDLEANKLINECAVHQVELSPF